MSWRRADKRDLNRILGYLLHQEDLCVPFTSRLKAKTRGYEVFFEESDAGEIEACMMHTAGGLLLPVLPASQLGRKDLAELIHTLGPAIHSIMGAGRCVDMVEACLPLPPTTRIDYFLMTLLRGQMKPVLTPQDTRITIRAADPMDADDLFALQKSYELEEVVISPAHFSDGQCMQLLRRTLREQLVFFAEKGGRPIAKAATNARGYSVDQIGGVFTAPEERNKGLAKAVVAQLLAAVFAEKPAACLFVKKHNRPALALYDRLGFQPVGDYAISYYGL